jgi:hypothetical protein
MEQEKNQEKDLNRLAGIALVFVVVIWVVGLIGTYHWFKEWEIRGQFGDMFGAVNALFSGLAFAGIIYTIYLQRNELQLQRAELELTRNELARSATAQEGATTAMSRQIEVASATARLAALTPLVDHYSALSTGRGSVEARRNARLKWASYNEQIENILEDLNNAQGTEV